MRAVVQIAEDCSVTVAGREVGRIDYGLLIYVAVSVDDSQREVDWLARKIGNLRIFPDANDRMNRSVLDVQAEALVVSQFTLYGDASAGNRPSYHRAATADDARRLYEAFLHSLRSLGIPTASGQFQASMRLRYTNCGPVTLLLDSDMML